MTKHPTSTMNRLPGRVPSGSAKPTAKGTKVTIPVRTEFGKHDFSVAAVLTGRIDYHRRFPVTAFRDGLRAADERTPWVEVEQSALIPGGRAPAGLLYVPALDAFTESGDDLLSVLNEYEWDDGQRALTGGA